MPALEHIGYKHKSLNIKPVQYPIVGGNLLQAIKEILGSAATDEVLDAWAAAYEVISDVVIRMEDKYITKPVRIKEFIHTVKSYLPKQSAIQ